MSKLIGITGGIGAGKSVVSRMLRLKGYEVYDCDSRARWLMENDPSIFDPLIGRFGSEAMMPEGRLNRQYIASRVFKSEEDRLWLNRLVHEAVKKDLVIWRDGHEDVCFVESAIIVSSGLDKICDRIWLVDAPEPMRKQRALCRGGISERDLTLRMKVQSNEFASLPQDRTDIIDNSGNRSLISQIDNLLK